MNGHRTGRLQALAIRWYRLPRWRRITIDTIATYGGVVLISMLILRPMTEHLPALGRFVVVGAVALIVNVARVYVAQYWRWLGARPVVVPDDRPEEGR